MVLVLFVTVLVTSAGFKPVTGTLIFVGVAINSMFNVDDL